MLSDKTTLQLTLLDHVIQSVKRLVDKSTILAAAAAVQQQNNAPNNNMYNDSFCGGLTNIKPSHWICSQTADAKKNVSDIVYVDFESSCENVTCAQVSSKLVPMIMTCLLRTRPQQCWHFLNYLYAVLEQIHTVHDDLLAMYIAYVSAWIVHTIHNTQREDTMYAPYETQETTERNENENADGMLTVLVLFLKNTCKLTKADLLQLGCFGFDLFNFLMMHRADWHVLETLCQAFSIEPSDLSAHAHRTWRWCCLVGNLNLATYVAKKCNMTHKDIQACGNYALCIISSCLTHAWVDIPIHEQIIMMMFRDQCIRDHYVNEKDRLGLEQQLKTSDTLMSLGTHSYAHSDLQNSIAKEFLFQSRILYQENELLLFSGMLRRNIDCFTTANFIPLSVLV